jgi:serine/threonine protein kinase
MRASATSTFSSTRADTTVEALPEVGPWFADWLQRAPSNPELNAAWNNGTVLKPSSPRAPGKALRHYKLGFQIAYGGTAAVHLGMLEGPGGIPRPVAMKRVRPGVPKERELRVALSEEARLGCFVRHPNVIPVFDLFESDGEVLLVMEYVVGETLARLQRRGETIPIPIAVAIMSGVLRGLHAAHTARGSSGESLNIVHRDVSPQNVLIGADGIARIIDFGMARAISREATEPGYVKGKIGYLAPEQVTRGQLDARTDVFGAGIVLWEALTGKRLFRAQDPIADVLLLISSPLTKASSLNSEVTRRLDAVLGRALQPVAERRFATAEEFAEALEDARRPANPSEVARFLKSRVGLAIEMQRTLLRGLQPQKESTNPMRVPSSEDGDPTILQLRGPAPTDPEIEDPTQLYVSTSARAAAKPAEEAASRHAGASEDVDRSLLLDEASSVRSRRSRTELLGTLARGAVTAAVVGIMLSFAATGAPTRPRPTTAAAPRPAAPRAPTPPPAPLSVATEGTSAAAPATATVAKDDQPAPSATAEAGAKRTVAVQEAERSEPPRPARVTPVAHAQPRATKASPRLKGKLSRSVAKSAAPAPAASSCSTPYYFDRHYIKRLKRECL